MARQLKFKLIPKLREDSGLYFSCKSSDSEQKTNGKYRLNLQVGQITAEYLKKITTEIYQTTLLHKKIAQSLNVVIIVKTNQGTSSHSHVILFSRDLDLSYGERIDDY
ncbi:hypothetical protein [Oscillatoria sp. HE19RPO]|uniref:hypothetical protein n=1 Tax=Oscillatoria sp. HE19RPO TaxID=2954806 RepID=UPI0020C498A0|nr:hypothetical protein [Oscillatoria sp. HE19RPO]